MKILLVNDSLKAAGAQRQFVELVKGLSAIKDIRVEILLFSDVVEYPEIYDTEVRINTYPRKTAFDRYSYSGMCETITRFEPDIVHSWHFIMNLYLLPTLFSRKGIVFIDGSIRDAHTPKLLSPRTVINFLSKQISSSIISNSKAGLEAYYVKSKGSVIYNGIDLKRFNENNVHLNLEQVVGFENSKIQGLQVVGMVARFDDHKDYGTFLSVAVKICASRNNVVFIAIGEGNDLQKLKRKYQNTKIIFPGRISNVEAFIQHFSVGVLLSNPEKHAEGISNSLLEYMASSKAVIATRGGGTTELVEHGVTGLLVEPNSEESFSQALISILDTKHKSQELGKAGLKKIKSEFSFEGMINKYLDLYKSVNNKNV